MTTGRSGKPSTQGVTSMLCVDVNVLLHLSNRGSRSHEAASAWFADATASGEPIVIPESVAVGFVRLATGRYVSARPLTPEQALDVLESFLDSPRITMFAARSSSYATFRSTVMALGLRGNDVPDAWIASVARDLSAAVVTFDRGFRRFPDLRVLLLEAPTA